MRACSLSTKVFHAATCGDHHRVIHIAHYAEARIRVHNVNRGTHLDGTGSLQRIFVPPGAELHRNNRVDDAATIGTNHVLGPVDSNRDFGTIDGHACKGTPTPDPAVSASGRCALRHGLGQQHSAQHPDPLGRPIARIRHDSWLVTALASKGLTSPVQPVFNTCRPMHELGSLRAVRRCSARSSHSPSLPRIWYAPFAARGITVPH